MKSERTAETMTLPDCRMGCGVPVQRREVYRHSRALAVLGWVLALPFLAGMVMLVVVDVDTGFSVMIFGLIPALIGAALSARKKVLVCPRCGAVTDRV